MNLEIQRLDHLGIVAGVIKDLKIIEMIDERIEPDEREDITTGEAIAGMILNGLGFMNKPLSLTPQFFKNKPLDILFREGITAEHFNRFKLGRSLDKANAYGLELLFSEISFTICQQERIDLYFNHIDTSSFSLDGEYLPDSDEQAVQIVRGHSKDHRPDLKQAVFEIITSQDGGVPILCKCHDGNASDSTIFKERCKELIEQFKDGQSPRCIVMDSKGYSEKNSPNLSQLPFITRIPGTIKAEKMIIEQALRWKDDWKEMDAEGYRYQVFELGHYHIDQRWLVIFSDQALSRSEKQVDKRRKKEAKQLEKSLYHLQAKRFSDKEEADKALEKISSKLKYHTIEKVTYQEIVKYQGRGKPTAKSKIKGIEWQVNAGFIKNNEAIEKDQKRGACFVIGTSIPNGELTDEEVFAGYKKQSTVEQGFRFLKDPLFFASSLFVKKPSRIEGLLMVMLLSLLVYSIAQRRMRQALENKNETLPNQIGQETKTPTLRWVFQMLEGINYVKMVVDGKINKFINGMDKTHHNIVELFGKTVSGLYQIPDS